MILLMLCWILFARVSLRIFSYIFISDIGLSFSFFVVSSIGFGIRVVVAFYNEFGSFSFSAIFWKSLRRTGVSSSLNFGWDRWLDSITDSMDPSLSNLWEMMKSREAWNVVVHGFIENWTRLGNWTTTTTTFGRIHLWSQGFCLLEDFFYYSFNFHACNWSLLIISDVLLFSVVRQLFL